MPWEVPHWRERPRRQDWPGLLALLLLVLLAVLAVLWLAVIGPLLFNADIGGALAD